jgi:hypothetical protein
MRCQVLSGSLRSIFFDDVKRVEQRISLNYLGIFLADTFGLFQCLKQPLIRCGVLYDQLRLTIDCQYFGATASPEAH